MHPPTRSTPSKASRMNLQRRHFLSAAAALSLPADRLWAQGAAASAEAVRLVIPFSAGATSDQLARTLVEAWQTDLGAPIVVDNKPGVGGMLGASEVARAQADGRTLAWGTVSNHAIAPSLYTRPLYDPLRDFTPVALLLSVPHVVMVHPSLTVSNLAELVVLLRANPGRFTYASSGNGTISHLIAEAFKAATGTYVVHIPYRSSAQGMPDSLAGRVDLMFDTVVVSRPVLQDGRSRALAVTSAQRSPVLPDVPTVQASGVDFEASGWFGVYGPKGLPADEVSRHNAALNRVLSDTGVQTRLRASGATILGGSAADFSAFNQREVARWSSLIRRLGVSVD